MLLTLHYSSIACARALLVAAHLGFILFLLLLLPHTQIKLKEAGNFSSRTAEMRADLGTAATDFSQYQTFDGPIPETVNGRWVDQHSAYTYASNVGLPSMSAGTHFSKSEAPVTSAARPFRAVKQAQPCDKLLAFSRHPARLPLHCITCC